MKIAQNRWGRVCRVSSSIGSRGSHLVALVELACRSRTPAHRVGAVGCRWLGPLVAARWPLPLPPRPSPVTGWVLGVFPGGRGSAERVCSSCPPRLRPLLQRSSPALGRRALLFWLRPPDPLHRHGLERPLRGPLAGSLRSVHSHVADPVPSPRFFTALTSFSARASRACFIPLPVRGSPCFGLRPPLREWVGPPHGAARTLRRMPLVSSRSASPRSLPSCRLRLSMSQLSLGLPGVRSLVLRSASGSTHVGWPRSGLPPVCGSSPRSGLPEGVALTAYLRSTSALSGS
jgi:hypothetical protein